MPSDDQYERTVEPLEKPKSLKEAIDLAMSRAKQFNNEVFFTYKGLSITSDILEGGNQGIIIKQPLNEKGGSFHTHPEQGVCSFSATDVFEDIRKNREEAKVGCPSEGKIVTLHIPKFKPFVKVMMNTLVDEMSIEKYRFAAEKIDQLTEKLKENPNIDATEIDRIGEQVKNDVLHGNNSDFDVYNVAVNNDFNKFYTMLGSMVKEEDWTDDNEEEEHPSAE